MQANIWHEALQLLLWMRSSDIKSQLKASRSINCFEINQKPFKVNQCWWKMGLFSAVLIHYNMAFNSTFNCSKNKYAKNKILWSYIIFWQQQIILLFSTKGNLVNVQDSLNNITVLLFYYSIIKSVMLNIKRNDKQSNRSIPNLGRLLLKLWK